MKILLIGGTGIISSEVSRLMAGAGHDVTVFNRGGRNHRLPEGVRILTGDIYDEAAAAKTLGGESYDCVADFIAFTPEHVERDFRLFKGKTEQFIFISSASAYQKPTVGFPVTESTPMVNPYWKYSREKIACENYLMERHREDGFPVTLVRPSHTYDEFSLPIGWPALRAMRDGRPVIIPGDGTTLWTLTHTADFARAFTGLIGNVHALGQAVHITSDQALTWNQIYGIIAGLLGVPLKAVHVASETLALCKSRDLRGQLMGDKANNTFFDNSKIKRLVPGWTAVIPFSEGVKKSVHNFLTLPELQKEEPEYEAFCEYVIKLNAEMTEKLRQFAANPEV